MERVVRDRWLLSLKAKIGLSRRNWLRFFQEVGAHLRKPRCEIEFSSGSVHRKGVSFKKAVKSGSLKEFSGDYASEVVFVIEEDISNLKSCAPQSDLHVILEADVVVFKDTKFNGEAIVDLVARTYARVYSKETDGLEGGVG